MIPASSESLRDRFAAQALVGLLAHGSLGDDRVLIAERAYLLADAMLEARRYTIHPWSASRAGQEDEEDVEETP